MMVHPAQATESTMDTAAKAHGQDEAERKRAIRRENAKLRKRKSRANQTEAQRAEEREKARVGMARLRSSERAGTHVTKGNKRQRRRATEAAKRKGPGPPIKPKRIRRSKSKYTTAIKPNNEPDTLLPPSLPSPSLPSPPSPSGCVTSGVITPSTTLSDDIDELLYDEAPLDLDTSDFLQKPDDALILPEWNCSIEPSWSDSIMSETALAPYYDEGQEKSS